MPKLVSEPPFTLSMIEAMSVAEMDALDREAIHTAAAAIPSLDEEALEEFIAALDLVKEHKQYAASEAYYEGDVELSERLAAAANAAIAAAKAELQAR